MPPILSPQDCTSMEELRAQIDRLDRDLIGLLVERASYIDRAIDLKGPQGMPARIPERVEEVVENVKAEAEANGLDPALVETLWRHLINWSIAREAKVITED